MEKYGYIRVSSKDQNPERQMLAMKQEEIKRENIYIDKISGSNFNRPAYKNLIKKIKEGDILVIKSIDRLGRNYNEILDQWRFIVKKKKVDIKVIDMPLLDTNYNNSNLMGVFIADLVLQILAYVAETERVFIRQRQAEGIAIAKMNGTKFGRNRINLPENFEECYYDWKNGKTTLRQSAEKAKMSNSTFFRRCKELDEKNCFK